MKDFFNDKLEEIRNSGRGKKMRWVAIMSAATMTVIVAFWLFYLGKNGRPVQGEAVEETVGKWEIFKSGFKIITSKLFGPRTINIE
jgi:hypothetical protein